MGAGEFLHKLPRNGLTNHFQLPEDGWRPSIEWFFQTESGSSDYVKGVSYFPFLGSIALVGLIFCWILFQISKCCQRKNNVKKIRKVWSGRCIFILLAFSFCGLVISIACCSATYTTVINVLQRIDDSADSYSLIVDELYDTSDNLQHSTDVLDKIKLEAPGVSEYTQEAKENIEKADNEIRDITSQADSIDWSIKNDGEYGLWAYLFVILLVTSLLFISSVVESFSCQTNYFCKCVWMHSTCLFLIILWVIILLQFTISTTISDACADKTDTIYQIYNRTDKPWEYAQYYVECSEASIFPWEEEYNTSHSALTDLRDDTEMVIDTLEPSGNLLHDLNDLKNTTDACIGNMEQIYSDLQCEHFHSDYEYITSKTCNRVVDLWFTTYFCHLMMVFCLCLSKFLNSRAVTYQSIHATRLGESFDSGLAMPYTARPSINL